MHHGIYHRVEDLGALLGEPGPVLSPYRASDSLPIKNDVGGSHQVGWAERGLW